MLGRPPRWCATLNADRFIRMSVGSIARLLRLGLAARALVLLYAERLDGAALIPDHDAAGRSSQGVTGRRSE
jgi:hypothetical protein